MALLDGIRILDLTSVIFGPYATQMLADMGAEVIKVEGGYGDISRFLGSSAGHPSMGSVHLTINRGKKSIRLNLKDAADAAVLRGLIPTADVFIHNVRAKAMARLGFGYPAVRAIRDDIIYVHLAGFGQDGPCADMPAYDDIIQAATGACRLQTGATGDDQPRFIPTVIADKVSGLYAAQAVLAAIIHKLHTGEGQAVEVPMLECFTSFLMTEHLRDATLDPPLGPAGYPRQLDPDLKPLPAADGHFAMVAQNDDKLVALIRLMGLEPMLDDPDFGDWRARGRNIGRIMAAMATRTPDQPVQWWLEALQALDIPAMPVRRIDDIFSEPQLAATEFFRLRTHPDVGDYFEMRPPVRFSAMPDRTLAPAPRVDADGPALRAEAAKQFP